MSATPNGHTKMTRDQALKLSPKKFALLKLIEQERVLGTLVPYSLDNDGLKPNYGLNINVADICYLMHAIKLGKSIDIKDSPSARSSSVTAFYIVGKIQGFKNKSNENSREIIKLVLNFFQSAIDLGEHYFDYLSPNAQYSVLASMLDSGFMQRRLNGNNEDPSVAQNYDQRCIAIGEPRFERLMTSSQGVVLQALVNSGVHYERHDKGIMGVAQKRIQYQRAVALGESRFNKFDEVALSALIQAAEWIESDAFNTRMRPSALLPITLVWTTWSAKPLHVPNGMTRAKATTRNRCADGPGSDRWLTRCKAFPAGLERVQQAGNVRMLARARLAVHSQHQGLAGLTNTVQEEKALSSIARKIASAHDWPLEVVGAAQSLLALLCAHAPNLLPDKLPPVGIPDLEWQPDIASIACALRFKAMRLDDGAWRPPYYWATLMPHPVINFSADSKEDAKCVHQWLGAWVEMSDGKAFSEALQLEWFSRITVIQDITAWLEQRNVPNAFTQARNASLLGKADKVVAAALSIPEAHSYSHRSSINRWLSELAAAHTGLQDTASGLARTLQDFAQGGLRQSDLTSDQAWELLESTRIGLACRAHPRKSNWSGWDDEAVKNIHQAELRALNEAELHIKARQANQPLPTPDQVDSRIEPFATMAEEWKRMGVDLVFETPASVASLLRAGESLVQLWWDEMDNPHPSDPALGYALWLCDSAGTQQAEHKTLNHMKLPVELSSPVIHRMVELWEKMSSTGKNATEVDVQIAQEAWDSMMAQGSTARALLDWLQQQSALAQPADPGQVADGQKLVLVFPPKIINLPWQALQEAVAPKMGIELAASVGAWAQSRRSFKSNTATKGSASVVMAQEIWDEGGAFEARKVAQIMEVEPTLSNDLADVITALQSDAPVHLAMHGYFDKHAPQRSGLQVDPLDDSTANEPSKVNEQ